MNAPRRKNNKRRGQGGKSQAKTAPPAEFWRAAPEPPEPPDITPLSVAEITALLDSMGTPPLPGQAAVADHYLRAAIEKAAGVAVALAASADLLDDGSE